MNTIHEKVNNYVLNAPQNIQEFVFAPHVAHPVWSDNQEVIQLAVRQILQPIGAIPDEQILSFIGAHARIITGKRNSIGFLITNYRVLSQTDYSVIGTAKEATTFLFTQNTLAEEIFSKAWNDFVLKSQVTINEETLSSLQVALKDIVSIVLPDLHERNYLPQEVMKSANIWERINELGLRNELKNYSDNEKKFKSFGEKYNIPNIITGCLDKPLFGGIYGFVIHGKGLTSRDLMEESVTSTWEEIKAFPATIGNKKEIIFAGKKNHIVPSHQKELVPAIITLVNEIASAEVEF